MTAQDGEMSLEKAIAVFDQWAADCARYPQFTENIKFVDAHRVIRQHIAQQTATIEQLRRAAERVAADPSNTMSLETLRDTASDADQD